MKNKLYPILHWQTTLILTPLLLGLLSCNELNNKHKNEFTNVDSISINNSKNDSSSYDDFKQYKKIVKFEYNDFEKFYLQFISDSIFQISRVHFPIKGQYQDYENEGEWTKSDWPIMNWDLRDLDNQEDSTSFIQTDKKFFWGTYCLDCGFSCEIEFNKIDDKWFLVYRQENNY